MTTPDPPRRRLLLISYWYPPAVGAAAERMLAFARHLPTHGWDVHVLTAQHGEALPSPCEEVTAVADPWRSRRSPIANYQPHTRPTFGSRLRGFLRDCIFPDRFVRWQRAAFHAALPLMAIRQFDFILASFPPASTVELALRLHEASGVPLILDYRDKWIGPGGYQPTRPRMKQRHADLEHRALAASAAVIAVSEALIQDIARVPVEQKSPLPSPASATTTIPSTVIYNGFEPIADLDTPRLRQPVPTGHCIIAHVGTVIPRNRPDLFFASVGALAGRGQTGRASHQLPGAPLPPVQFRFVGNLAPAFLRQSNLESAITTTGLVPRETARLEMWRADALLLLTGAYVGQWGYSVKLFEYLQTGRPILCLEEAPGSNDARLLRELAPERCFIGKLGDVDSLVEQVNRLRAYLAEAARSSTGVSVPASPGLARFSRANQATELARFLNTLTKKN